MRAVAIDMDRRIYALTWLLGVSLPGPAQEEATAPQAPRPGSPAVESPESPAPQDSPEQQEIVRQLTELDIGQLTEIEVDRVSAASLHEQALSEAPASVTIVTSDQIRKYGYRTLGEILASAPGAYVTYDRNYHYLGLRGFNRPGDYNSRFLLLVDGHRLNENIYGSATIDNTFVLDVDLIDRVEIIRGPGSAIYGSNAFFGVINVITKTGASLSTAEVAAKAGSFDSYEARLTYGKVFLTDLHVILSASWYSSAGQSHFFREFDDPSTNSGIARKSDGEAAYAVFGKASYKDFVLEAAYNWRDKELPTAPFGTVFNSDDTHTVDAQGFVVLKYSRRVADVLSISAAASYNDYYYRGEYEYDAPVRFINKDTATGRWAGGEIVLGTDIVPRNVLTAGFEVHYNFQQDQHNYDQTVHLDDERDNLNWGLFLQDEIRVLENLSLVAGVRYDRYETFGDTFNPRAALIYKPFEPTTIKVLYGQAFRAPSVFELYYDDGNVAIKKNPDLDAEKITTYEAVLEQEVSESLTFAGSVYQYKVQDLITQVTDPADGLAQYRNTGDVTARGLEASLRARLPLGYRIRASYAYQLAEDEDDHLLSNSPRSIAKLSALAPLLSEKVFLGLEVRYMSSRRTLSGNEVNGFFVTNLTLFGQEVLKGLDLSASAYNLFNHKYADPAGNEHVEDVIDQDGRSFWFQITYRF